MSVRVTSSNQKPAPLRLASLKVWSPLPAVVASRGLLASASPTRTLAPEMAAPDLASMT